MEYSSAAVTYAEQLVSRGYGLPLWHPEPQPGVFGQVEIGDVGFLSEGRFFRLFNALHSASHPINAHGVPPGFVKLEPNDELLKDDPRAVEPKPICTTSTVYKQTAVGAGVPLNIAGVEAKYSFSSSADSGAVAVLGDYGHQQWYLSNRQFRDYIVTHHASWYAFADEKGYLLSPDAIILVSGWLKTSEWAIATFSNYDRSQQIDLHASVGSYASAVFRTSSGNVTQLSIEQRSGPQALLTMQDAPLPRDQCLFLRYYKLKSRAFGRPRVLLRADARDVQPWPDTLLLSPRSYLSFDSASSNKVPHSRLRYRLRRFIRFGRQQRSQHRVAHALITSDATRMYSGSLLSSPSNAEEVSQMCRDPVDDVLDYILENHPMVDVAVACFEDAYVALSAACSAQSPSEWLGLKAPPVAMSLCQTGTGSARPDVGIVGYLDEQPPPSAPTGTSTLLDSEVLAPQGRAGDTGGGVPERIQSDNLYGNPPYHSSLAFA